MSRGPDDFASTSIPTEIWGRVAKYLTLRECCMLASTCKALWTMDLQCVILPFAKEGCGELNPGVSGPVLAWAAKRWTRALMLKIQTWHGNVKALSMALANSQSNDLTHLEEVCPLDCSHHCHRSHSKLLSRPVGLRVRQLHVENEGGDSQLACEIACTWLLTQARNIKVLNAKITCFDSFGAARGLKHLMLHVTGVDDDCLSSSLSVLERLRTLWISRVAISEQQTSGALHLSALHSLDRLALENYVPRTIQLAESCELHVVHFSLFAAEHAVWDTVLPNLRSFRLDSCDQELLALPSCLRNASNLAAVWVDIECFGTAAAPLQLHGALAHVAELTVQCTHLHAVVPSGVSWQHINFSARGVLDMRAEALSSFAEAIPALCFRYHSLQGTFLSELAVVLARKGAEWNGHFCEDGISGLCFPMAQQPSSEATEYDCRCGACLHCLSIRGKLDPCLVNAAGESMLE